MSEPMYVLSKFGSPAEAAEAFVAAQDYLEKNEYPDDLDGTPEVTLGGTTVAVYHDYADFEMFTDYADGVEDVLEQRGGSTDGYQEGRITIEVLATLPTASTALAETLDQFFRAPDGAAQPWNPDQEWKGVSYDADDVLWFRVGSSIGFRVPLESANEPTDIEKFFATHGGTTRSSLSDRHVWERLLLVSHGSNCLDCLEKTAYQLGNGLEQDRFYCDGCDRSYSPGEMSAQQAALTLSAEKLSAVATTGDAIYVVGYDHDGTQLIYRSRADSEFRIVRCMPNRGVLSGVWAISESTAVAVGRKIVRTTNGHDFEEGESPSSEKLLAITGTPSGTLFCAGMDISRSEDHGASWELVELCEKAVVSLAAANDSTIYAVGFGGSIRCSSDGGSTWREQISGIDTDLRGVCALDSQHAVAVGAQGVALMTSDGGETWLAGRSGTNLDIECVVAGSDGWVYAITRLKKSKANTLDQLLISEDQGKTWKASDLRTNSEVESGHQSWGMAATPTGIVIVGNGSLVLRHGVRT